jgi:GDP-D-mannose dehydratase
MAWTSLAAEHWINLFCCEIWTWRNWVWAPDYVETKHLILNIEPADEYVIVTGTTQSLGQFADSTFAAIDHATEE